MVELSLWMALFVISHLALTAKPAKDRILVHVKPGAFKAAFALVAGLFLVMAILAYRDASYVAFYHPPVWLKHGAVSLMIIAIGLLVFSGVKPMDGDGNPLGIHQITHHPMLWGVSLWAFLHMVALGHLAAWIFFGGFLLLAQVGAWRLDRRKERFGPSSNLPFAAVAAGRVTLTRVGFALSRIFITLGLWAVILGLHGVVFGVEPVPMPW